MIGIDMEENLLNVEELIKKTIKDFNKNIIFELSRVNINHYHTSGPNGTCISLTANVKKDGINNTICKNLTLTDEFIEIIEKEILCSFLLHKLNRFFGGYEILEVYDE